MAFDRDEIAAASSRAAPEEINRLRMHQQAAVRMDLLTGDPSWDQYLSYLEAQIGGAKKNREGLMASLANPSLVNADKVALVRTALLRLDAQITTLEWCVAMPSQIKKLGAVSKGYLDKIALQENSEAA